MTIYLTNDKITELRSYLPKLTGYTLYIENSVTACTYDIEDSGLTEFNNSFLLNLTGVDKPYTTLINLDPATYNYEIQLNGECCTDGKMVIVGEKPELKVVDTTKKKLKIAKL